MNKWKLYKAQCRGEVNDEPGSVVRAVIGRRASCALIGRSGGSRPEDEGREGDLLSVWPHEPQDGRPGCWNCEDSRTECAGWDSAALSSHTTPASPSPAAALST